MSTLHSWFRRATDLFRLSPGTAQHRMASAPDGETVFCKNNVCVHPPLSSKNGIVHHPGYLTIRAHQDQVLGSVLYLTWIPNKSLEKNPRSLENQTPCSSPCRSSCPSICPSPIVHRKFELGRSHTPGEDAARLSLNDDQQSISSVLSDMGSPPEDRGSLESWTASDQAENTASTMGSPTGLPLDSSDGDIKVISDAENIGGIVEDSLNRDGSGPAILGPEEVTAALESMISGLDRIGTSDNVCPAGESSAEIHPSKQPTNESAELGGELSVTQLNSGPTTAATFNAPSGDDADYGGGGDNASRHTSHLRQLSECNGKISPVHGGSGIVPSATGDAPNLETEISTVPGCGALSTGSSEGPDSARESPHVEHDLLLERLRSSSRFMLEEGTPEQLAHARNLTFPDNVSLGSVRSLSSRRISRESACGIFSVDLSQMRSLRLFFSNRECTSGQLVIASRESQYKIFHFHHGGLDKLAGVLADLDFLTKSKKEHCPYEHFSVGKPNVSAEECHPEEGAFATVDEDVWREHMNDDGAIEDDFQLRKAIFFRGLDPRLRRDAWPFLLQRYNFSSTFDEREQIRNDKFLEYQNIRKLREQMSVEEREVFWRNVECTVEKDVVRTDRSNPFYAGDDNPNIETMKNILLNYAACYPELGYTQGMSDLLAPVLAEMQDEAEAFWCFVGLMQRTIFVSSPKDGDMDVNLNYLRELLRVMTPTFHGHLKSRHPEALELLFVHRWLVLCFKREFPEGEALQMWEACWAHYQTDYFHLFLSAAIVALYGQDVVQMDMGSDEMLLHFSSLAGHMQGDLVLRKARGLLYQFRLLPRIPCTLAGLCELCSPGMWDSGHVPVIECRGKHGGRSCPHGGQDPTPNPTGGL